MGNIILTQIPAQSTVGSQNEAVEVIALPEKNLLKFLHMLYINFKLLKNKRKEQSDSRRRQCRAPPEQNSCLRYWQST